MKRTRAGRQSPGSQPPQPGSALPDAHSIDALYGLEPVFEPETRDTKGGTQLQPVQCPYCGEGFDTLVDLSAGSASYIEDCQVCCQPIQFELEVGHDGELIALTASRGD